MRPQHSATGTHDFLLPSRANKYQITAGVIAAVAGAALIWTGVTGLAQSWRELQRPEKAGENVSH